MPAPEDRRERELVEIDMYDQLSPQASEAYQARLLKAMSFIEPQFGSSDNPQNKQIRRKILNNTGLAGGDTNFWANPELYAPLRSDIGYGEHFEHGLKKADAYVGSNNPAYMAYNPYGRDVNASRILPHEYTHMKQFLHDRRKNVPSHLFLSGQYKPTKDENWAPNFSDAFMKDLYQRLLHEYRGTQHPYNGAGFGSDPYETMGHLMGREGELRAGQTLRNDPATKHIWDAYPGMYEEYLKSREKLRRIR